MSDITHWDGCWREHHACAVALARQIQHCENCGDTWCDSGLASAWCPYCKIAEQQKRIAELEQQLGVEQIGNDFAQVRIAQLERLLDSATEVIDATRTELSAARANAERYRWLRDPTRTPQGRFVTWPFGPAWTPLKGADLDAAIDAARFGESTTDYLTVGAFPAAHALANLSPVLNPR